MTTAEDILIDVQLIDLTHREAQFVRAELIDKINSAIAAAVSAEREACAKIADGKAGQCGLSYSDSDEDTARSNGWDWACDSIAAAIRARSNKTK